MGKASDVIEGGRFVGEEVDGQRIRDGERLKVCWPDGAVEVVKAAVRQDGIQTYRAHCMVAYHGAAAEVQLCRAANVERLVGTCTCEDGSCAVCKERWAKAAESARKKALAARARATMADVAYGNTAIVKPSTPPKKRRRKA